MPGEGNYNRRQGGHGLAGRIRGQYAQQNPGEICEEIGFPKECVFRSERHVRSRSAASV